MNLLRQLAFACVALLSFGAANADITVIPDPPVAGTPFKVAVGGAWRDSCVPVRRSLTVVERTIHVTYGISGGGCFSAVSPWADEIPVPALSAGTYELRARLLDFDGLVPFFNETITVTGTPSGIESVSPAIDSSAGNRVVTIRGSFPCEGSGCPPPTVLFGGTAAEAVERISESVLQAVVPAQTNIPRVNVTVRGVAYTHVRYSAFTYVGLNEYERVLLPVYTRKDVPGGYGSLWRSEFHMVNRSSVPLENDFDILHVNQQCGGMRCATLLEKDVMETPSFAWPHPDVQTPATVLAYVRKEFAPYLAWNLRIRDLSRQAESWGTEIPVVREKDFGWSVTLVDVPAQPRFRRLLRVYMPDYVGCCAARATFRKADGTLIREAGIPMTRANGTIGGLVPPPYTREGSREFPLQPAYGEVNIDDIAMLAGGESFWIKVDSSNYGSRVWAFVSITNDDTQHVTLVTPQQ